MVNLTFRTIRGSTFQLEVAETVTVAELKALVESSQGAGFPKDQVRCSLQATAGAFHAQEINGNGWEGAQPILHRCTHRRSLALVTCWRPLAKVHSTVARQPSWLPEL